MADILREFYQQIETALRTIVGQAPTQALDETLFRTQVIERGWQALPAHLKEMGRQPLRWDEILLLLRREVYSNNKGKLALRDDAAGRIFSALSQLLGGEATEPPPLAAPVRAVPARPVQAAPVPATPVATPVAPQGQLVKPPPRSASPAPAAAKSRASKPAAPPAHAVGIDLGTTYSLVAHMDAHGRPATIPNAAGELLTPSVVLFEEGGVVVGKQAVLASGMEPDRIAECFKRDMGAKAYRRKVGGKEYPPEVLSAFVLRSLRADAERKLGSVRKAVVTVPAYFDEMRRRATVDAGRLAGIEVLDIINEPTAAAIAYGYQVGYLDRQGATGDKPVRVLVYDLGGGTFDVTILEMKGTSFKALATDGDVYLGGKDWDEKLLEIAAERFKKQAGQDPRKTPATLQELWIAVEGAKRTLTERGKATLYLNVGGKRAKVEITREEFEEATAALLDRTRTTCEIVVRQSGLPWSDIDKVLLVGGSTRMPMVSKMLQDLTGKPPDRSVNPDEAVAHGAALYADLILRKQGGAGQTRFSVTNINSHSLGIVGVDPQTKQRKNQVLIAKNTPLPQTVTRVFRTMQQGQPLVTIRVVEGESERVEACAQIGILTIRDLPASLPEGWPVQVSYSYQENGQLHVSAKLQGHPSVVTTYFLRENSLEENDLKNWSEFVKKEWGKRKD